MRVSIPTISKFAIILLYIIYVEDQNLALNASHRRLLVDHPSHRHCQDQSEIPGT